MKNSIHHPKFPSPRRHRGFALVVTLSLMILLTVIAVGLLSLSSISLRSSSQSMAQANAQANARMALMLAIGELQKEMGPDQRISANSAILDQSAVQHSNWLGVWNSWKAGAGEASQHSTIQGIADKMAPSYLPNRSDYFRKWLVSLNENEMSNVSSPKNLSLNASPLPGSNNDAVFLVAGGSLGSDAVQIPNYVAARILDIKDKGTSEITGRYGWWIGDESQKARIMDDSYLTTPPVASADKIFRSQAPGAMGTKTLSGLKNVTDDSQYAKIPSLATIDLIPNVVGRPSKENFLAATPYSFAVLTDVREGGLKRDLNTLLERPIPNPIDPDVSKREQSNEFMLYKFNVKDAWANDAVKYPTLPNTPQECVPMQDLAAFYQLYDKSRKAGIKYTSPQLSNSIQVTTPDYGTPADYTTKYQREYTTLYRNPVPIKVQFMLTLLADPITAADRAMTSSGNLVNSCIPATDTHKLRFGVIPAITLWNPYNVPIVMEAGESLAQQIVVKPPPLAIVTRKKRADGTAYQNSTALSLANMVTGAGGERRADIIRLNFARTTPIVFQPGEVRVFSPSKVAGYFLNSGTQYYHAPQSMTSSKNLVDAMPGWNPNGILPLKFSSIPDTIQRTTNNPNSKNILWEVAAAGANRWCLTMNANSSDAFEFAIFGESPTNTLPLTSVTSAGTAPIGAAFCFYMAQRIYSSQGGERGYGYLNLRQMGLTSRFGPTTLPAAFNDQILRQGAATIQLGTSLEPIPAGTITGAANAGESVPFMQFALMAGCETSESANGGLVSGRKFPSRPFLHSSPLQANFIDQSDGTAPYNHGWNWWIDEMNSILESMVQESQSGNGFYGGGYSAECGATHVVQQEIPIVPPISIAALSHARIGGFTLANEAPVGHGFTGLLMEGSAPSIGHIAEPRPTLGFQRVTATGQAGLYPHVLQAIGNSYANPNLEAGAAFDSAWKRHFSQNDGERNVTFADHSYLANKALWDEFFFSSITPQPGTVEIFGGSARDAKQVASDFFFNAKPLPNRRMTPEMTGMDSAELDTLFAAKNTYNNGLADKIAAHLMVKGGFNINSTSVLAWKVFFSSLKGKPIAYLDTGKVPKEATTGNTVPVGMSSLPNGLPASTADTENPRDPAQWKGLRGISEDEIDALAQAMVREVKKRGPFLSLSEFANRRLDSNNTQAMALKGALQAALDYDGADGEGPEVTINKNFRSPARILDSEVASIDFAFKDAAKGPAAYGSSAYVDQADVLRQFAEQLTPRGDTFVIRSYGDALDTKGKVVARAWCEAVVQRNPNYVDEADEPHIKTAALKSDANKLFGRKIQIISFRWLNASEI